MLLVSVLVLVICGGTCSADDIPVDITQSLMTLMAEEKEIQTHLQQDISQMGIKLNHLKELRKNVSCNCPWHQAPVAFSATLTSDITSLGVKQQIPFDKVITNLGDAYDKRHGEFRAPVTGTYQFAVSLLMNPGHWAGLEIVRDGVTEARTRTGDSAQWTMGSVVVDLQLTAGQDVWVEHISESDSNVIYGQQYSTFCGYLIQP